MLRLDVGAGEHPRPNCTHMDLKEGPCIEVVADARQIPYPDNSVDELYCSHLLEHFVLEDVYKVLKEFGRVLKKDGFIKLAVPNFGNYYKEYVSGKWNMEKMYEQVFGGQRHQYDFHYICYDEEFLKKIVIEAGFRLVGGFDSLDRDEIVCVLMKA